MPVVEAAGAGRAASEGSEDGRDRECQGGCGQSMVTIGGGVGTEALRRS